VTSTPISVVVPTYNEAQNLPVLYGRLAEALGAAGRPFELLVVDDDSPDGTAEVVAALGANARCIVRKGERGLATAVIRGIASATHPIVVVMDADLSHPPEIVPALIERLEAGGRFAIGSRYTEGGRTEDWSFLRAVNSWGATVLARPLTRVRDPMSGFFAVRQADVPIAALNPIGYKIALEILVKAGIKDPVEVPIVFTDRLHGESKMGFGEQARYLQHLQRLYAYRYPTLTQFVAFAIVGSSGFVVDLSVNLLAVETFHLPFAFARMLGIAVAMTSNFVLNDRFTFHPGASYHRPWIARYLAFVGTCSIPAVVNFAVSVGLKTTVPLFSRFYPLAVMAGAVAGLLFNFAGAKWFVFRRVEDDR
jgi:dolichol-phosphate mannosyltransferase